MGTETVPLSDLRKGSFITLVLILSLISSPVYAASENRVGVNVMGMSVVDFDANTVSPGEYPATVEYGINVWNERDDSRKSLRSIKITIKPEKPEGIEWVDTNNAELISRDPIIAVGKGIGEDDGMGVNVRTKARTTLHLPLQIERGADVTYFEGTGEQVASLRVTPASSNIRGLHVRFDFKSWGGREETEVSFVSASREHFDRSKGDWAEFHVENPIEGKEYVFAVQLEVTPLHETATYLPNVWVSVMMDRKELEHVTGKVYKQETELASFEVESADEVVFVPFVEREVGIGLQGISTQAKLLEIATPPPTEEGKLIPSRESEETLSTEAKGEEPAVVLPMGQPIMKVSKEGGLYGVDWEFVGVIIVVLGTLAGTTITWVKGKKRRGAVSRYIRQIDVAYTMPEAGPAEKRDELRKMKRKISKEFGKGKFDESAYSILDKRIDDYLKELRESAGKISNVELKAEIDKILEDGIVTKDEYEEFTEMLEEGHELKEGEKKELKEKIKKIRDESEKKGF